MPVKALHTASGEGKLRFLHTLALLWGERDALGSVWWVSSAADAGARAAVRGAGHLSAHGRTISERRKRGCLSPVVVSVLAGENRGNVSPTKIWKVQTLKAFFFLFCELSEESYSWLQSNSSNLHWPNDGSTSLTHLCINTEQCCHLAL